MWTSTLVRRLSTDVAYVVTDQPDAEHHQHPDDLEVTARSVLTGVLHHVASEPSAHETIAAEQQAWASVGQLAGEYETIAAGRPPPTRQLDATGDRRGRLPRPLPHRHRQPTRPDVRRQHRPARRRCPSPSRATTSTTPRGSHPVTPRRAGPHVEPSERRTVPV